MAVIRCQACGKPNPDFLEACQYCSARLKPLTAGSADETLIAGQPEIVRCQACGGANPAHLEVCQHCQARLKPLSAGQAAPSAPADDADPLARLRAAQAASSPYEAEVGESAEPAEPEPDWMNRLRDFGAVTQAGSADIDETLITSPARRSAAAEPDWMWKGTSEADEGGSAPESEPGAAQPPAASQPAPASDVPHWLKGTGALFADDNATLPDWMLADDTAPGTAGDEPPARRAEWQTALLPETPLAAEPPAEQAPPAADESLTVHDTVVPFDAEPPPSPPPPKKKKMTDWLTRVDDIRPAEGEEAQPAVEAELPEWLRAMQPTEADALPSWLKDSEPAAPAAADIPDWLKALRPEELPDVPAAQPADDMPEWLRAAQPAEAEPITPEPAAGDEAPPTFMPPADAAPEAPAEAAPAQPEAEAVVEATPDAPAEPAPEAEPAQAEEVPAWLQALRASTPLDLSADETRIAAGPRQQSLPEWMQAPEPGEMPDWLKGEPAAEAGVPAEGAATPLGDLGTGELDQLPTGPLPQPEPVLDDETLSWLNSITAGAESAPVEDKAPEAGAAEGGEAEGDAAEAAHPVPVDVPELDEETLTWLGSLSKQDDGSPPAQPAWMEELAAATAASARPAEEAPEAAIEPTPEEELPDWLKALRGMPVEDQQPVEEMPDWLRALRGLPPVAPEEPAHVARPPEPGGEAGDEAAAVELAKGGLPDWLAAMRPVDDAIETEAEGEVVYEENVGVLAGMRGVLRAEPVVAQPHRSHTVVHRLEVSDTHAAQAKLLQEVIAPEAAPAAPAARPRVRSLAAYVERWIVFAVLAVAILAAQFPLAGLFAPPSAISPDALAAFNVVQSADARRPALVAFDYDAALHGELSPGASAVVTHLLRRGVPVVAVSTRPTGAGVAQLVLTEAAAALADEAPVPFEPGTHYLNLGYIAGGPVGVLPFAATPRWLVRGDFAGVRGQGDVWGLPILSQVYSLADFSAIVLVTGTPEDARAWIEQAQAYAADTPMVAVASAAAEPLLRPYREAAVPQLDGLVGGLAGAAQYEAQANVPGQAGSRLSALGGGLLAAALLMAVGNLIYGIAGRFRRR